MFEIDFGGEPAPDRRSAMDQLVLTLYSLYNQTRPHLGLGKDAPLGRAVERSGTVIAVPILSGLHHRYARI